MKQSNAKLRFSGSELMLTATGYPVEYSTTFHLFEPKIKQIIVNLLLIIFYCKVYVYFLL